MYDNIVEKILLKVWQIRFSKSVLKPIMHNFIVVGHRSFAFLSLVYLDYASCKKYGRPKGENYMEDLYNRRRWLEDSKRQLGSRECMDIDAWALPYTYYRHYKDYIRNDFNNMHESVFYHGGAENFLL